MSDSIRAEVAAPDRDAEAERRLVHSALKFAVWAAGEGIAPAEGEPARAPEDFLMEYAEATGDEDWDGLPDRIAGEASP